MSSRIKTTKIKTTTTKAIKNKQSKLNYASHPASISKDDQPCYYGSLPAELQVMICEFAYGNENSIVRSTEEVMASRAKTASQSKRARSTKKSIGLPTFEHTIKQFLVSKTFFAMASEVYLSKATVIRKWRRGNISLFGMSLLQRFVGCAQIFFPAEISLLRPFLQLKKLTLCVWRETFDPLERDIPWDKDLGDDEFAVLKVTKQMRNLSPRRIAVTCVSFHTEYDMKTAEQDFRWASNVRALENFFNSPAMNKLRTKSTG